MSYGNEDKLLNKLPVVKSNPLVEAKFKTTALEYKILMVAASKIKSTDMVLKDIAFSVHEFCKILDVQVEGGGMYEYMKRTCERLVGKTVSVKNERFKELFSEKQKSEKGYTIFPWLHHIEYDDATVYIRFHEYMKPLLLYALSNVEYTKYLLGNITKCDSIYSMRIYELLKQYQKIGERTIELSELREMLGIEKTEYKLYGDFKKKTLEHARKEINEKTDIRVEYEEKKKSRKVTAITFSIRPNAKNIQGDHRSLEALPKEQLVKLLQLEIQNRYVVVMDKDVMNQYSEKVLAKLLQSLRDGDFEKTNIYRPLGFFTWKLEEIASKYVE